MTAEIHDSSMQVDWRSDTSGAVSQPVGPLITPDKRARELGLTTASDRAESQRGSVILISTSNDIQISTDQEDTPSLSSNKSGEVVLVSASSEVEKGTDQSSQSLATNLLVNAASCVTSILGATAFGFGVARVLSGPSPKQSGETDS